jgi:hypothetical protein
MTQWLNRESWVWDRLTHANVLLFLGISNNAGDEGSSPAFVSPLCTNGHITDYLKTQAHHVIQEVYIDP